MWGEFSHIEHKISYIELNMDAVLYQTVSVKILLDFYVTVGSPFIFLSYAW